MKQEKKKDFFFEILSEEIPARMQKRAILSAKETIGRILTQNHLEHGNIEASAAPRRLCVCVRDVESITPAFQEEKKGPKLQAGEHAVDGFVRANHLKRSDLIEKDGNFWVLQEKPSRFFKDQIPEIFGAFLNAMPWQKSMHWYNPQTDSHSLMWVRPIRSVVCLLGETCIPFEIKGCGITAGDITYGHRFLSNVPLKVTSFEQYKQILKEHGVWVEYEDRKEAIIQAAQTAAQEHAVHWKENPGLLDEITGLVDAPFAIIGTIDPVFMTLPEAVLSTSMRIHQKYFSMVHSDQSMAPFFMGFSNRSEHPGSQRIREGMEKVLRARLSDAAFFYKTDLETSLESRAPLLETIVFHEKLGSLGQKVKRLMRIVPSAERAAQLCKLDLVSEMVREFEELQGIMGKHYALAQGEDTEVAQAIEDHYRPNGQGDALPETKMGALLAVADRVDTLVGFLGVGIRPTGSKDPFALRRAGLGIIRILLKEKTIHWVDLMKRSREAYREQGVLLEASILQNVVDFLGERFSFYLKDQLHIRFDVIQSVTAFYKTQKESSVNFSDLYERALAIQDFLMSSSGANLMALFRRVNGILSQQELNSQDDVSWASLTESEELSVIRALDDVFSKKTDFFLQKQYKNELQLIASLHDPLMHFLDCIQINTLDEAKKKARLALLQRCRTLYQELADFSQIQDEGANVQTAR